MFLEENMPKIEPFENHYEKYEEWFNKNEFAYQSELNAVKELLPEKGKGIEIGVGSGRFAAPLGIKFGIDPSEKMLEIAKRRGIDVKIGVAENLPYENGSFDYALMVTTICFVDDIEQSFREAYRILKKGGVIVIGFVDKDSKIGKEYQKIKDKSLFYGPATFFSVEEVESYLKEVGFKNFDYRQTIFNTLNKIKSVEPVKNGYGEGSFIVIRAEKM